MLLHEALMSFLIARRAFHEEPLKAVQPRFALSVALGCHT